MAQGPIAPRSGSKVSAGVGRGQGEKSKLSRFGKGNSWASKGGLARAEKARQLRALTGLGLRGSAPEDMAPFLADALEFAEAEVKRLALECGGGVCAPNACALVQQAALAMAASRAKYAMGELNDGAKLGQEVRQNLLAAREICVRDAQSRVKKQDPHEQFNQEFGS